MFVNGVSYIDSSRGVHSWRWGEDVYHRRAGDRVWYFCGCSVWACLLVHNLVLNVDRGLAPTKKDLTESVKSFNYEKIGTLINGKLPRKKNAADIIGHANIQIHFLPIFCLCPASLRSFIKNDKLTIKHIMGIQTADWAARKNRYVPIRRQIFKFT